VEKNLDMVVANDVSQAGAGFNVDTNRVTLILRDGSEENLPLMQKEELADVILDRVAALLRKKNRL
jgi:phosphopantothenoylcysteine decarboxylase/phosphopantothenate--cysteine ligase